MQKLTFEQLPSAISQLFEKVLKIEELLHQKQETGEHQKTDDELLTVEQAAVFLNLKKSSIYSKVSRNELPVMKRSKKLYFSKLELMQYLKDGRVKTNAELEAEAETYLSNNKKRFNYAK